MWPQEAALTEVSDRVAARFDQGLSVHHPKPTAIGKVVVELVNAAAALHAEVVTAAPSQVAAPLACESPGGMMGMEGGMRGALTCQPGPPPQVSAVLNKIVGQALAHLAQAVANIQASGAVPLQTRHRKGRGGGD